MEKRHEKLLLHTGLLLLRIDDLGLRTLLAHRLGDAVHSLDGPYMAVPQALAAKVEQLVKKEGYSPRRIS